MAERRAKKNAKKGPARRRRSAEEAREQILDAAEKRLQEVGPAGIRLQELARDIGVSHPTILHHFGSREALVEAVVIRALAALQADAITAWAKDGFEAPDAEALLRRVQATLADRGHARLLAWLALEGRSGNDEAHTLAVLARAMHERRRLETRSDPPLEDTVFVVVLVAFALFGEAIMGSSFLQSAGLEHDQDAPRRFRRWLVGVVHDHAHSVGAARDRRPSTPG